MPVLISFLEAIIFLLMAFGGYRIFTLVNASDFETNTKADMHPTSTPSPSLDASPTHIPLPEVESSSARPSEVAEPSENALIKQAKTQSERTVQNNKPDPHREERQRQLKRFREDLKRMQSLNGDQS